MKLRHFSLIQFLLLLLVLFSNVLALTADTDTRLELLPHLLISNGLVLILLVALTRQQLLAPLRELAKQAQAANRTADGRLRVDCGIELCETVLIGAVLRELQQATTPSTPTATTPQAANPTGDTGTLPPLAGLELAQGLSQHAGDLPRYTAALAAFPGTFANISGQLTAIINQGDWDTALPLVEALQRSATAIGAVRVVEQADSLLSACQRRDDIDARVALPPLASALAPIVQGLERHFSEHPTT
jgi:hypothetical protein